MLFLVVEGAEKIDQTMKSFARIVIDTVEGILTSGVETWGERGPPIETIANHECRRNREVDAAGKKHIPGAVHQYVGDLEKDLPLII